MEITLNIVNWPEYHVAGRERESKRVSWLTTRWPIRDDHYQLIVIFEHHTAYSERESQQPATDVVVCKSSLASFDSSMFFSAVFNCRVIVM